MLLCRALQTLVCSLFPKDLLVVLTGRVIRGRPLRKIYTLAEKQKLVVAVAVTTVTSFNIVPGSSCPDSVC